MGGASIRGVAVAVLLLGAACRGGDDGGDARDDARGDDAGRWRPDVTDTWQWQLQGTVSTGYDVDVYDVDLVETPQDVLAELHDDGRRVVCYFSAGTWEAFRDGDPPPDEAIGEPLTGFPDERWLDVRHDAVRDLAVGRLDLAAERGCDGVEPDNVDGHANDSGFDLSAGDQLAFNRFLAAEAHARGLSIGLKNDLDHVPDLVDEFDFAVNEQCHEFDECAAVEPFVAAGKPVFNAEYADGFRHDPEPLCDDSRRRGLRTLVLPVDLDDAFRISCD